MVKQILISTFLILSSCMSTTVVLSEKWDRDTEPAYVDNFDFYLVGLVGHEGVNLGQVCMDQKPHAVNRRKNFEDIFLMGITLGIYSPITVRVWCGD